MKISTLIMVCMMIHISAFTFAEEREPGNEAIEKEKNYVIAPWYFQTLTWEAAAVFSLRYHLHTENRVNFRVDYVWDEDDDEDFYVSSSEAF